MAPGQRHPDSRNQSPYNVSSNTTPNDKKAENLQKGRIRSKLRELGAWSKELDDQFKELSLDQMKAMLADEEEKANMEQVSKETAPKPPKDEKQANSGQTAPPQPQHQAPSGNGGVDPTQLAAAVAEAVTRANQEISKKDPKPDVRGYFNEADVPKDDAIEEERFFAPRFYHLISRTLRTGNPTAPPYNRWLHFTNPKWIPDGNGGAKYVSVLKVKSRKVLEWLLAHEEFGLTFYRNPTEAATSDHTRMEVAQRHMQSLANKGFPELMRIAHNSGMGNVSMDIEPRQLRIALAHHMTEQTLMQEARRIEEMASRTDKQKYLALQATEGAPEHVASGVRRELSRT